MQKQQFKVTLRVDCEIESSGKPYLTEARVTKQLQKFLSGRSMAEGLPCHGTSTIRVTDCIEEKLP